MHIVAKPMSKDIEIYNRIEFLPALPYSGSEVNLKRAKLI